MSLEHEISNLIHTDNESNFGVKYVVQLAHTITELLSPCVNSTKSESSRVEVIAAAYLEEWLDNDKNAAQTIYSFASETYQSRDVHKNNKSKIPDDDRISALRRGNYIFSDMQDLRCKQAEAENEDTASNQTLYKYEDGGNQYGFTSLNFIDLYCKRYMTLYELLILRKKVMQITSKKESLEPIRDGFKDLSYIFSEANLMNDIEYVVTTFQMWKLERAYRFGLSAEIAQFVSAHNVEDVLGTIKSEKSKMCWGRYNVPRWLGIYGEGIKEIKSHAYDILNYHKEVRDVFEQAGETHVVAKMCSQRILLSNIIDAMNHIKNPRKVRSWDSHDFNDAANFFRRNYSILGGTLLSPIIWLIGASDKDLKVIRDIYEWFATEPTMPLFGFRAEMQKRQKDRNKKAHKKR